MYHLITEEWNGSTITVRQDDAWWNLTEMCAAFEKEPYEFLRLPSTKSYIEALIKKLGLMCENLTTNTDSNSVKIPQLKGVMETRTGRYSSGTWAHPFLAMECARWLSPEFSIKCNEVIIRILNGETIQGAPMTPTMRRLRKQKLRIRGTELRVEIDSVRKQLDAMRSSEDIPGHLAVREWLAENGHQLSPGDLSSIGYHLSKAARLGKITQGEKTIAINSKARQARVSSYPPEAIAAIYAELFPSQLIEG